MRRNRDWRRCRKEDQVEEGRPSASAVISAMCRAAHMLWDEPPKIFEDSFALPLSGCNREDALKTQMEQLQAEVAQATNPEFAPTLRRSVTAAVVTRSRYLEEEVDQAVVRGVFEYVILGAGLDSFAYRRPELAKVLHIFEVDHPATQAWKLTRLRAAGVELPANLSLVPVDFEKESLIDKLRMSGNRTDARASKMPQTHEGGCLCGAVRYRVVREPTMAGVCHCNFCKRGTGSAFRVAAWFDQAAVEVTHGVLKVYEYSSDESNRWIKLEFCPTCGTTVTYTAQWVPGIRGIRAGTFDDPNWIKPAVHVWTRSALRWIVLPPDVELLRPPLHQPIVQCEALTGG